MKCDDRQHFIHISYSFPIAGNVFFRAVGGFQQDSHISQNHGEINSMMSLYSDAC